MFNLAFHPAQKNSGKDHPRCPQIIDCTKDREQPLFEGLQSFPFEFQSFQIHFHFVQISFLVGLNEMGEIRTLFTAEVFLWSS